jgi:hypothetical protein
MIGLAIGALGVGVVAYALLVPVRRAMQVDATAAMR